MVTVQWPDPIDRAEGGILGALIGDAMGVPYEFRPPNPDLGAQVLEFRRPTQFIPFHADVPPGTWSDDGAQVLCLLASLLKCGRLDLEDLGRALLAWLDRGQYAVDRLVFDVGLQTAAALAHLRDGAVARRSGLTGERSNGNGSLMRIIGLPIWHTGSDEQLASDANQQSMLTHAHPLSRACCALYALWARCEFYGFADAFTEAVRRFRRIFPVHHVLRDALEQRIVPDPPPVGGGTGYVVDCLHSARVACSESDYPSVIARAISLGNDTDTTACVAGGIAGIRWGRQGIPLQWRVGLRGRAMLEPLLIQLRVVVSRRSA